MLDASTIGLFIFLIFKNIFNLKLIKKFIQRLEQRVHSIRGKMFANDVKNRRISFCICFRRWYIDLVERTFWKSQLSSTISIDILFMGVDF